MNSSGKVLTIFAVITAILLISLTALSLFFFQKETDRRKLAELTLEEYRSERTKLEDALKGIKKQNFLLQEKNKEADERINDLSDDLELEKGLREEMRLETSALKEKVEETLKTRDELINEIQAKEDLKERLTSDLLNSEQRIKELEAQLKAEIERGQKLGQLYEQQQTQASKPNEGQAYQDVAEKKMTDTETLDEVDPVSDKNVSGRILSLGIELDEIIVVPEGELSEREPVAVADPAAEVTLEEKEEVVAVVGQILSVDTDTEFVIVSLGKEDGLDVDNILSVYRDEEYLGDIKITRLQSEMSAADLIPPFSIRAVQKSDQVKVK